MAGQLIEVFDSGSNNRTFRIERISTDGTQLILVKDHVVIQETCNPEAMTGETPCTVTIIAGAPRLNAAPILDFLDNSGNPTDQRDTIERDGGSWIDDGFEPGQKIRIAGVSADNDGIYTLADVKADVLVLSAADVLTTELDVDSFGATVTVPVTTSATVPRLLGEPNVEVFTLTTDQALPTEGEGLKGASLRLIRGTGVGQERQILSNTATTITVRDDFRGEIGAGTRWEIRRYDKLPIVSVDVRIEDGRIGAVPALSADPAVTPLTFTDDARADTIERPAGSGSWIDDGFERGQLVTSRSRARS